jgi:hypothetical protein
MQHPLVAAIVLAILAVAVAGCACTSQSAVSPGEDGHPPFLAVSITRQPSAEFSDAPAAATVTTKENQVFAGLHRFGAAEGALDLGLDYQYTRYVYDGIDGRNRDLHRFQFPLRYRNMQAGWNIDGSIAPGISTSSNVLKEFSDRISSDDLFVTARLEGQRAWRSRTWVLGLAYDRAFGRPLLYPIAGLEFSPGDHLDVRLAFPDSGFQYRWSDRQSLTGRLFPAGHQWHVMTDDFSAEFDYRVEGIRAQLGWSLRLWKQLTLDLSGGYEFGRKHYLTDDLGERIVSDVEDQWLVLFGIRAGPAPLPYTHGGQL